MLNDILTCGERHCYLDAGNIAWLKELKDRVKPQPKQEWKPSDEQFEALKKAINIKPFENPSDNLLWELYTQLKKLREE